MSEPSKFRFRLFVAGDTLNSSQAISNLMAMCEKYLPRRHHVEIIDVFAHPKRALRDKVLMTPMLLKLDPTPSKRVVGTLKDTALILRILEIGAVL